MILCRLGGGLKAGGGGDGEVRLNLVGSALDEAFSVCFWG